MSLTFDDLTDLLENTAGAVDDITKLCICLLFKRENDGLNGRTWNASKHSIWEKRTRDILERFDYMGLTETKEVEK